MKNIKKSLKRDIDKSVKYDLDAVKEKCGIGSEPSGKVLVMSNGEQRSSSRAIMLILIAMLSCLLLFFGAFMLIKDKGSKTSPKHQFLIVDINPSLEIEYDENERVVAVKAYNEDAEIVLSDVELSSLKYKDALSVIFDKCIELGYISPSRDDNAIMVSVVNEDGSKNEEMTSDAKEKLATEFLSKKILGVVITGVVNPDLQDDAEKYGIDVQKYSYIQEYLNMGGELDENEFSKVSIRQIRSLIYEKEKEQRQELISSKNELASELQKPLMLAIPQMAISTAQIVDARLAVLKLNQEENEEKINAYTDILQRLGKLNNGNPSEYIQDFALILNDLVLIEAEKELLASYQEFISELEVAKELFASLDELNKSFEERAKDKKDAIGEAPSGSATNVDKWQSERENDISSNWFDHKSKWEQDLMAPNKKNESATPAPPQKPSNERNEQEDMQGNTPSDSGTEQGQIESNSKNEPSDFPKEPQKPSNHPYDKNHLLKGLLGY